MNVFYSLRLWFPAGYCGMLIERRRHVHETKYRFSFLAKKRQKQERCVDQFKLRACYHSNVGSINRFSAVFVC